MQKKLSAFFDDETAAGAGLIERTAVPDAGYDPEITALEYDSRAVREGALYFALPGLHTDGRHFITEAIRRGARAVVHQHEISPDLRAEYAADGNAVFLRVPDARFAMSPVAASFWGRPARDLVIIGVTGTEGKSTIVSLVWQLLRRAGKKAGFISTVQYSLGGDAEWNPDHQTTPEATVIHAKLAAMRDSGAEYAVLESSSHGLSRRTNRLGDIFFDAGVMVNVTHEHLEFHGTWEQYRSDKANLFRALARPRAARGAERGIKNTVPPFAVINADDPSAEYFAAAAEGADVYRYSTRGKAADLSTAEIESGADGNRYAITVRGDGGAERVPVMDRLPGAFNAGNVLASLIVVSRLLNSTVETLIPFVPELIPVRGRMTAINRGQPFEVLVDYAHTPSSFAAIFPPLRDRLSRRGGRIIALFGSAGERDTAKRPLQGKIAGEFADIIVLTNEDPRREDPRAILDAIARGAAEAGCTAAGRLHLVIDRALAIRRAFSLAREGDLVLLLGKGHENTIIHDGYECPWDEIAEAERALDEMGFRVPVAAVSGIAVP
ncbi:MAG: UDP-N-acetylmuramoyl-L-alanyl-D-glutamate--2,6-diaminopimelate ligase [Spirochaetaceae bacterium]|jgi:UDP-N-acetylmuramoyl-L-alanyl-D-glutamate--2,6-diaminopimelate ligase|nr:UDP-N-acetylmuramoyl-L-alanyl-D-glutamate--2,6-diaminopimelate ligase [Spirochaetaceae bacterium]